LERFLFPIWSSILYWLQKEDKYSIQSPFLGELYHNLKQYLQNNPDGNQKIEDWRAKLLTDEEVLTINDFGAGSKKLKKNAFRKTKDITQYSTTQKKFNLIYQFFCMQSPAYHVLEFGTCVGINTLYLAEIAKNPVWTFEGAEGLIQKAKEAPESEKNHYILGDISKTLPQILEKIKRVDYVLMDANHTYDATIEYFYLLQPYIHNDSILAIGDIHWSKEMESAWNTIIQNPEVTLSLDFYECGILFFKKELQKNHHILSI
jgi:predicted O-methyltransferase YrrM